MALGKSVKGEIQHVGSTASPAWKPSRSSTSLSASATSRSPAPALSGWQISDISMPRTFPQRCIGSASPIRPSAHHLHLVPASSALPRRAGLSRPAPRRSSARGRLCLLEADPGRAPPQRPRGIYGREEFFHPSAAGRGEHLKVDCRRRLIRLAACRTIDTPRAAGSHLRNKNAPRPHGWEAGSSRPGETLPRRLAGSISQPALLMLITGVV